MGKNKFLEVMASMGSKFTKSFGIEIGKEDTDSLTAISNNMVLVFDDLERICSDKISVKEVLGIINEYSEHNHYKVIIVCNEDVYAGKVEGIARDDEYWKYKEKTIRYTYKFEADVAKVFDAIVETYEDVNYKRYLEQMKKLILNIFELGGKKNLRTLKFYMDSMFKLFNNTPTVKYKESILRMLFVSTLIYITEYKNGKGKEMLEELKATYEIDLKSSFFEIQTQEQEERTLSYSEEVAKVYGSFYDEMGRLPFVVEYLITGYLAIQSLEKWVYEQNKELENAEIKPEYQLIRELNSFAMIDDETVVEKLRLVLQYVMDGKYGVIDLMQVYALLVKYHCFGLEGFSLTDDIERVFKDAIDRYKDDWKYVQSLELKIPMWDDRERGQESFDKYDVLKKHVLQMNYQSRLAEEKTDYNDFLQKAESGDVEGVRYYREKSEKRISIRDIDWGKICNILERGSNPIACEVALCLQSFLPNSSAIRPDDLEPLKNGLQKWLEDYAQKGDKRIRRMYILQLKRHIDNIIRSY